MPTTDTIDHLFPYVSFKQTADNPNVTPDNVAEPYKNDGLVDNVLSLLIDAEYQSGIRRSFETNNKDIPGSHWIILDVKRFSTPQGAESYLEWKSGYTEAHLSSGATFEEHSFSGQQGWLWSSAVPAIGLYEGHNMKVMTMQFDSDVWELTGQSRVDGDPLPDLIVIGEEIFNGY